MKRVHPCKLVILIVSILCIILWSTMPRISRLSLKICEFQSFANFRVLTLRIAIIVKFLQFKILTGSANCVSDVVLPCGFGVTSSFPFLLGFTLLCCLTFVGVLTLVLYRCIGINISVVHTDENMGRYNTCSLLYRSYAALFRK